MAMVCLPWFPLGCPPAGYGRVACIVSRLALSGFHCTHEIACLFGDSVRACPVCPVRYSLCAKDYVEEWVHALWLFFAVSALSRVRGTVQVYVGVGRRVHLFLACVCCPVFPEPCSRGAVVEIPRFL